jgi:hypothetical protein
MQVGGASVMLSAMNKAPPTYTDPALAREEARPVEPGDKEVSPDGGAVPTADAASTVDRSPADDSTVSDTAIRPSITGIGVLIVNLGTPDAPTPAAVRRYLKEFLTDPRVIEKDSIFWKLLLNIFILTQSARLRKNLEPREGRIAVQDDYPFPGRKTQRDS